MSETQATTAIIWFRNDLRLSDNAALLKACQHKSVVPLYIFDENAARKLGAAKRLWLHHALDELILNLSNLGNELILRFGDEEAILQDIIDQTDAKAVYWNRRYEPDAIKTDTKLKSLLKIQNVHAESFSGHLLHEPTQLTTKSGTPFRVFTPFWKTLDATIEVQAPYPAPTSMPQAPNGLESIDLNDLKLLPTNPDWSSGILNRFTPGGSAAQKILNDYLQNGAANYKEQRDFPALDATSKLSPYLTFGEISPRQIWHASENVSGTQPFRRQLAWRDFSYHLLFHNPDLDEVNFNNAFDGFQWDKNDELLGIWQKGQTGYPIVDAGMRELWQTGYMHNRVRMIVASFLTKHLLIDWREGEKWFWDTLVDADPANNTAGWQWVAGSGADASPYYRIFNPIIQGKKFDEHGEYVKTYVPELKDLDAKYIHAPWETPEDVLKSISLELGTDYPKPIVDHSFARNRALEAYGQMKQAA
ncbi:MAG: deoxyribodipyrimidine photo-lyase [Rhizobiaceae bacterium]|nr:deoxyribodipyrimidine photo-lyase [Rhizobiaceae bacterium]